MAKITIITPKENLDNLLKVVVKTKLIHLSQVDSDLYLNEIHEFNLQREELHYLNSVYQDLDRFFLAYGKSLESVDNGIKEEISFDQTKEQLLEIQETQNNLKQEIALIEQNDNILSQYEDLVDNFQNIIPNLPKQSDLTTRGIIISNLNSEIQNLLNKTLNKETEGNFHLQLHQLSPNMAIGSITYPKLFDQNMKKLLEKLNITDLVLPKDVPGITIDEKLKNFELQKNSNQELRKKLLFNLDILYKKYLHLTEHKKFIYDSFYNLECLKYLRSSEFFVVLEGFIPINKVGSLKEILDVQLQENYSINTEKIIKDAPVKLKNFRGIREFEIFTGMVQPIAYNTIDPTIFMAFVFPFFFGFIIGDIGYGLIITLIGLSLYLHYYHSNSEMKSISDLGWIYFVSGLFTIFFGFLYGEFFGDLGNYFGLKPLLYHRNEKILDLLLISIVIGVIHIMFGIFLGIINALKIHDHHKIGSGIGYFLTNLGLISLFSSFILPYLRFLIPIGSIFFLIGIIVLFIYEGIIALIEIISYLGNMLSYARLMALGIASVILAEIANKFYFIAGGGIPGILLAVSMHILGIAIAMFSPLIHSMRLHLVEFFSKFVFDGIETYQPFGIDLISK